MKHAGIGLEEVTSESVQLIGWDGVVLEGDGPRHSEWPIHTEVMAARPEVSGVVHVHSRFAVALASSGAELRPISHEANYFAPVGVPRFGQTGDLILTRELGHALASTLDQANGVFLVNHGIVTVGVDLRDATVAAIVLDRACEVQLFTRGFGGDPTWSSDAESLLKRDHIYGNGSTRQVWDYLVRQLGVKS